MDNNTDYSPQRRNFLASGSMAVLGGTGLASLLSSAMPTKAMAATPVVTNASQAVSDIVALNAVDLSAAIKARKVSCHEVMRAYLAQIEYINPKVNAIVSLQDGDALLKQADERDQQLAKGQYLGWMHGMPHAVKDLALTAGILTTYGSPIYEHLIPKSDEFFVERIRHQGAILIGKTNAPEFGLGSNTYNPIFGVTRNAYDQSKIAGGSSGGAAVSLALKMVPVADGSDMMGSLRNPAAYNNIFGFRTSAGLIPAGPNAELFLGQLSVDGALGRTVTDLAMLLSTQAGYDERAPLTINENPARFSEPLKRDFKGTRVAWLGDLDGYLPMEDGVMELCQSSFKSFEAIGCKVEPAKFPFSPERLWKTWLTLRHAHLAGGDLGTKYRDAKYRAMMKPELIWEIEGGLNLSVQDFYQASRDRSAFYLAFTEMLNHYDYVMLPTAQLFPFSTDLHWPKSIAGKTMDTYHRWMEVVIPVSLAGTPAVSVPVGFGKQGLPMGVQLIGKRGADLEVLQLAYAYEQATQWVQRHPPALLNV